MAAKDRSLIQAYYTKSWTSVKYVYKYMTIKTLPLTDKLANACAASLCTSGSTDLASGIKSFNPPYSTICTWRVGLTASFANFSATWAKLVQGKSIRHLRYRI